VAATKPKDWDIFVYSINSKTMGEKAFAVLKRRSKKLTGVEKSPPHSPKWYWSLGSQSICSYCLGFDILFQNQISKPY